MCYQCIQSWRETPDNLLPDYFELLTNLDLATLPENPREAQKTIGN